MKKAIALARRELIEHRNGIVVTPLLLMGLMLLLVVGALGFQLGQFAFGRGQLLGGAGEMLDMLAAVDPAARAGRIITLLALPILPALVILPAVIFFVLLGALYEERRDRSFLFWKSLPVSDTQEVLAKLITGLFVAPAVFVLIGIAVQLVMLLLISVIGALQGGAVWALWDLRSIFGHWMYLPLLLFVWAFWAAPVFAWVLFASAYAPRAPFMYAVVPPAALAVLEEVLFDTSRLLEWIGSHLAGVPLLEGMARRASYVQRFEGDGFEIFANQLASPDIGALLAGFGHADLWLGLAVAAGLGWGAVWLRRYNL